eukprot:12496081-Alexandrium_andersonii.AAC.1
MSGDEKDLPASACFNPCALEQIHARPVGRASAIPPPMIRQRCAASIQTGQRLARLCCRALPVGSRTAA